MQQNILVDYFNEKKRDILDQCTRCGLCVMRCPAYDHNPDRTKAIEIQTKVMSFLEDGIVDDTVYDRGFSCFNCYKCITTHCPQGLNPMLINELIRSEYRKNRLEVMEYDRPGSETHSKKILAALLTTPEEFNRITTESAADTVRYVFFPGCNVYAQPEKILTTLDILDEITDDLAFIPGCDSCCGNTPVYYGDPAQGGLAMKELVDKVLSYKPEKLIVWCPTCLCEFKTTIEEAMDLPFEIVSVGQFIMEHISDLTLHAVPQKTATLHEACKTSYTSFDLDSVRSILDHIPGITRVEMAHCGQDTLCCGLGAELYSIKARESMVDQRLDEATDTQADLLIDVCHACHGIFVQNPVPREYEITNFISVLAKSMGIEREDRFQILCKMNKISEVLSYCGDHWKQLPFTKKTIIAGIRQNIPDLVNDIDKC